MPGFKLCLACLATAAVGIAPAAEAGGRGKIKVFTEPTPTYLEHRAELEAMLSSRDVELFELDFKPLELERIVLTPRVGPPRVFHYLAFRLRNTITDDTQASQAKHTRYNEVLAQAAEQYEAAKVANGVTLEVAGEKVLDRAELRARERRVNITAIAYDENGSRIRLLDVAPGKGPQEDYNFDDQGEVEQGAALRRVREKVEEKVGRRLKTVDEIRAEPLPAYDATQVNDYGEATGEVFGVILFDRLNDHGDRFTIEVRGLNNKLRVRQPPSEPVKVDDYLQSRVLRRVYVLHYERPGDEWFRDQDRFDLTKGGWEWVNTFQRLEHRKSVAYANFFKDNIADENGERRPEVEEEFWPYYDAVRAARPDAGDKLPDLQGVFKKGE